MKNLIIAIFTLCNLSSAAQISFTSLSNQPPDNIVSIVTDPTNNDMYAAATFRVIRSVNNGASYTVTANTGAQNLNLVYCTAAGQLYAGADKTNTSSVGLIKYNKVTNLWSEVPGSPQDITAMVEDNSGNLIIGTGTTGNYGIASPVNKGAGLYLYNTVSGTFTALNNGLLFLPTYSVYPFIKSLVKSSTGVIYAGTYGGGVYKWSGTLWSNYGSALTNIYINTLKLNTNDSLYAGGDAGINVIGNTGGAWAILNTGLPAGKPVRTITIDAAGKLYAGLGYYHYQNGNMAGDIYTSSNIGTTWQNANTGYVGGVIYSILAHPSGNVFAGSAGIWQSANSGALWSYNMTGVKLANQTIKMVENSAGDIFVLCRNNQLGTRLPYGGVFRSTDNGATWMQLVNGIKAQGLFEIFIDSHDNIWLSGSTIRPNANGTGTIWGTPELYKSTNNGLTWVRNMSIVAASDTYTHVAESRNGKIYVASSFGTSVSNLSSSNDYNTFDNTLNLPPNNGGYSYGLAVNNNNDVFHGTETNGIMRSTSNGAPGSFATIAAGGNTTVFVDPYTQYIFSSAFGTDPNIHFNFSTNTNNGSNMTALANYPTFWANTQDMAFTNTGKIYCVVNSSHFNQVGLYLMQSPVTASSAFTMLINFGTLSFYFNTLFIDKCGYLYGIAQGGGGISVSTQPVNTPLQTALLTPANNAIGIILTPSLIWAPVCNPDSFRLQIATDTFFNTIIKDQSAITTGNYNVPVALLNPATKYFWRVYGVNAAGAGKWSTVNSFTTLSVLPLSFLDFSGKYVSGNIDLTWTTANGINDLYFIVEKSKDGLTFNSIGNVSSSPQSRYSFKDNNPFEKNNYYRIKQVDADGKFSYSKMIFIEVNKNENESMLVFPNPARISCTVQVPDSRSIYILTVFNSKGVLVMQLKTVAGNKTFKADLRSLPAGPYWFKLVDTKTNPGTSVIKVLNTR